MEELEEVTSHVGDRTGVPLHQLQVLLRHLPHRGLLPREQGGVVEVALCRGTQVLRVFSDMTEWGDYEHECLGIFFCFIGKYNQ